MTFLNEVETHTGKAVLLKLSRRFESRYRIAHAIDRNLWLARDRFSPIMPGGRGRCGPPTARWRTRPAAGPLRWVVVQP